MRYGEGTEFAVSLDFESKHPVNFNHVVNLQVLPKSIFGRFDERRGYGGNSEIVDVSEKNGVERALVEVGLDLTASVGVDAGEVLVVALERLEGAVLSVVWGVVGASDAVINMFAEVSSVGASRVADLDAEEVSTEEAKTEG